MLVAGIKTKEELVKLINREPLIDASASSEGISSIDEVKALYFGVGICNGVPLLSRGLPVDVLSMILTAEQLDVPKNFLIADTHALSNNFSQHEVDIVAGCYQEKIQRAIENMGLKNWEIVLASQIDKSKQYLDLLSSVQGSHEYIRRELADMLWFVNEKKVNLKVGWALKGSKNSDEKSFDKKFQEQFDEKLGFVYNVPGRTFNPSRPRAAPYFSAINRDRIMLDSDEDVAAKLSFAQEIHGKHGRKPYEKFLGHLVRFYERTNGKLEHGPISDRLQQIISICTK